MKGFFTWSMKGHTTGLYVVQDPLIVVPLVAVDGRRSTTTLTDIEPLPLLKKAWRNGLCQFKAHYSWKKDSYWDPFLRHYYFLCMGLGVR